MSWRQDQLSWDLFLNFLPLPSSGEGRHKPLLGRWVETTVSKMESPAVTPETGPRAMPGDASSSLGQSHRIMAATMGTRWDITTSITVPHPGTSAPAPAEQHHPLFQMTPPECNWSRHRAPRGASSRSLPAFDSLQQVLPICTGSIPPCPGLWAVEHLTQEGTQPESHECLRAAAWRNRADTFSLFPNFPPPAVGVFPLLRLPQPSEGGMLCNRSPREGKLSHSTAGWGHGRGTREGSE